MSEDVKKSTSTEHETQQPEVVESAEETETSEAQPVEKETEVEETETAKEEISETGDADTSLDADAEAQIGNLKKHEAALLLIEKTRHIVDDTEKQLDACKLLLQDDLKRYEEAKLSLKEHALDESESLLKVLGYEEEDEETLEDIVTFQPKEELPPFEVKEISSGKFTSLLLALVAGFLTFAGLIYLATEKAGITLDVTKMPTQETATKVLGWYATLFGDKPDLFLGGAFVFVVVMLVMGIIYGIRVASRSSSNLAFAKQQLEEAQEYAKQKGNCKEEMDRVDAHMNDAIAVLKTYEVVLGEQNGKLKRILHIEGVKEHENEYHPKSLNEMHETKKLIESIEQFMNTSMSEEGKLSQKSKVLLENAKEKLQQFIDKLY